LQIVDKQELHLLELALHRLQPIAPHGLDHSHSQIGGRHQLHERRV
jgi:hypothetical protein